MPSGAGARLPPRFWGLVVLVGVGAGIGGGLLMWLLRAVQHAAFGYHSGTFLEGVERASGTRRVLVVLLAGLLIGGVRWAMRQQAGEHRGSIGDSAQGNIGHAAEITAAIWFRSGRVAPVRATVSAVLSIVGVGMGAPLGREAAPKEWGAVLGSMLSEWTRLPSPQRRLLVACGAGAGMAAAYNVPFGGALFALEVMLGTLALPLVAPALATSLIATAVSWAFLGNQVIYDTPSFGSAPGEIVWAALAGPVAGLATVAYIRLIAWATARKPKGVRLRGARMVILPAAVFAVLGCLAIPFPELLGNGKDVVQRSFDGALPITLLLPLLILRPLATGACLGTGAPGGLFTPTMTLGALVGATLGWVWGFVWPGAALPGAYALTASAAVLAAATQAPISSIALAMELTHHLDTSIVPVLMAVSGATVVARHFEARSIYSGRIHSSRHAGGAGKRPQEDEGGFETISAAAPYAEVLRAVLHVGDRARPIRVLDENGETLGTVARIKVMQPDESVMPLAVATAADFIDWHERT